MAVLTVKHKLYNDDGDEEWVVLPAKYEVCDRCQGRGSHVNPSIDGHGLSQEDFDEDPDFREDYFSGRYDVACYSCGGLRVVLTEDESMFNDAQKADMVRLNAFWEEELADDAMSRAERAMGA